MLSNDNEGRGQQEIRQQQINWVFFFLKETAQWRMTPTEQRTFVR